MEQLILHLIGDYLLQTDWMARNKKVKTLTGHSACLLHCLVYSLPFFLIADMEQVFYIFATHFIIDRHQFVRWYMNVAGMKGFAQPPTGPWSIFFVDNTFHLICNYLILRFI